VFEFVWALGTSFSVHVQDKHASLPPPPASRAFPFLLTQRRVLTVGSVAIGRVSRSISHTHHAREKESRACLMLHLAMFPNMCTLAHADNR